MKRLFMTACLLPLFLLAGTADPPPLWPLPDGGALTSSFCEARINRLHLGWDVSINKEIGLPVLAPRDGVITRLKLEWRGYGRAVYIDHGDGWVTVFAHLDRFEESRLGLETLAAKACPPGQPFAGNIFPKQGIPVKRGQVIGFAGGGGVGAPHLHLETRFKGSPENPGRFGLIPPDIGPSTVTPLRLWLIPQADDPRSTLPGGPLAVDLVAEAPGRFRLREDPHWSLPPPRLVLEVADIMADESKRGLAEISGRLGDSSLGSFAPMACSFKQTRRGKTLYHQGITSGGHCGIRLPLEKELETIPGIRGGGPMPSKPGAYPLSLQVRGVTGALISVEGRLRLTAPGKQKEVGRGVFWGKGKSVSLGPLRAGADALWESSWVNAEDLGLRPQGSPLQGGSTVWEIGPDSLIIDQGLDLSLPLPKGEAPGGWSIYRLYNGQDWLPVKSSVTAGIAHARLSRTGRYALLKDDQAPVPAEPYLRWLPLPRRLELHFPQQEFGAGLQWDAVQVQFRNLHDPPLVIFDPDENEGHGAGVAEVTHLAGRALTGRFRVRDKAGNVSVWKGFEVELKIPGTEDQGEK